MAKLRTNHTKGSNSGKFILRALALMLFVGFLMLYAYGKMSSTEESNSSPTVDEDPLLPTSSTGDVIKHTHYTLSYDEAHEQAEWVAYKLTKTSLRIPNVDRETRFNPDPMVLTRSAHHRDYSRSGYTRGHLAPAGDMAFDKNAMHESFYMSNMSPQKRAFNGGIWRELEETVRDWAFDENELYIVTGPVLTQEHITHTIGKTSDVSVSDLFYKIIVDLEKPEQKGIAFLIPNERSEQPLQNYIVTIDKVEEVTGIDFFAGAFDQRLEEKLEGNVQTKKWKFSSKRYKDRVNHWNNR